MNTPPVRVLFVCLGNICRSPTAHGVFEELARSRAPDLSLEVDSCGTGGWHVGEPPDRRATAAAVRRGYDLSRLRARQFQADDFQRFDYILAMDHTNLGDLEALRPAGYEGHLGLFLAFAEGVSELEVPDPYYGDGDGFALVLDLVEAASSGLLEAIRRASGA